MRRLTTSQDNDLKFNIDDTHDLAHRGLYIEIRRDFIILQDVCSLILDALP